MLDFLCRDRIFTNIRAVIFDKDGTLENSGDYLRRLAERRSRLINAQINGIGASLLMAFGVVADKLDPAGLQAIGSRRENEIAAAAYIAETGVGWAEALEIAHLAFIRADRELLSHPGDLFPGTLAVIQGLCSAGLKLGILSAADTNSVTEFADYHQLHPYFQSLLGSDRDYAKPDPRLFYLACRELGVEPAQTLVVGDGVWDMVMGKQGGAGGCIGITWGTPDRPLAGADVTIDCLSQLQIRT